MSDTPRTDDTCNHDFIERETACADGFCPICATIKLIERSGLIDEAKAKIMQLERELAEAQAEIESLRGSCSLLKDQFRWLMKQNEANHKANEMAQAEITRLKGEAESWEKVFDKTCEHLAEARDQRDKAIAFLRVYRNDTPLGHQPHMLAHEVDQFLKEE